MHEIGLCEGVLSVTLQAAGGEPVTRVRVRHGRLQGIVPESMDLAWRMVSEGTLAEGSVVELEEVPLQVRCRACGRETQPSGGLAACAACASGDVEVRTGEELQVAEVELRGGAVRRNPELVEVGTGPGPHSHGAEEET